MTQMIPNETHLQRTWLQYIAAMDGPDVPQQLHPMDFSRGNHWSLQTADDFQIETGGLTSAPAASYPIISDFCGYF
jgi:hypothetical protein